MITDLILIAICSPIILLTKLLPSFDASQADQFVSSDVFSTINELLATAQYFIPVKALMPILAISLGLGAIKIVMAVIVRIKSFIPTMGA